MNDEQIERSTRRQRRGSRNQDHAEGDAVMSKKRMTQPKREAVWLIMTDRESRESAVVGFRTRAKAQKVAGSLPLVPSLVPFVERLPGDVVLMEVLA